MKLPDGPWVLGTGSRRGFGQQIVMGLAEKKCKIIIHYRSKDHVWQKLELLNPYSVKVDTAVDKYVCDQAAELMNTNVLVNTLDPIWLLTDMGELNAMDPVEAVLPGALVPALPEDFGPSVRFSAAQDYRLLEE
jgi:NAD(P)-dependent dehydrogenase (short-subunit alcohol dehydrogenase family)